MYTNLQLDFIRAFGDKELKFGCLIFIKEKQIIRQMDSHDMPCDEGEIWREGGNAEPYLLTKDFEILGSEPHLFPDVAKKLKEKIDEDLNKMCEFKVTMDSIEIYGYRSVTGELKEFGPANNVFTKIQEIHFDPCLPILSQPKVMEALLFLIK